MRRPATSGTARVAAPAPAVVFAAAALLAAAGGAAPAAAQNIQAIVRQDRMALGRAVLRAMDTNTDDALDGRELAACRCRDWDRDGDATVSLEEFAAGFADAPAGRRDALARALDARPAGAADAPNAVAPNNAAPNAAPAAARSRGAARPRPAAPAPAPGVQPARAGLVGGRPVGLFYMQRVWMNGSIEKAVWYFAPDGRVYQNLTDGFSAADLAAHAGPKGTYAVAGGELRVRWADGTAEGYAMQPSASGFSWNLGVFTPVRPFRPGAALAGTYAGGELFRASAGNSAMSSTTLELRADGTYASGGAGTAQSTTGATRLSAGAAGGGAGGTWQLAGHAMTLRGTDGRATRAIAFPLDDASTPVYPDYLYVGGTMYKRESP